MNRDDPDWTGVSEDKSRAGYEWGLASLLMGGMVMVFSPGVMLCNIQLWMGVWRTLSRGELNLLAVGSVIGVVLVTILCVLAIALGIKGLRRARWYGQPTGIPTAAILVSCLALFLWAAAGGVLIAVTQTWVRW